MRNPRNVWEKGEEQLSDEKKKMSPRGWSGEGKKKFCGGNNSLETGARAGGGEWVS